MKNFVKQPVLWTVLGILVVALMIALMRLEYRSNTEVKPQEISLSTDVLVVDHKSIEKNQAVEYTHGVDRQNSINSDNKMPRHQDMLSKDMKQAIRDKLLFHGPMKVIYHPDGRVELPSNGRFTQMPVAVEMPDGSIEIKEYSVLPE